ncbi:MAG: transposase [Chloroflexota bacterium]
MSQYRRKNSLRPQGYDYSQSGAYFVTIAAYKRLYIFGQINDGTMTLSKLGTVITDCWKSIPTHNLCVELDAYVVMPNHMHGILVLQDSETHKVSLIHIINTFKGAVTRIARKSQLDIDLEHPVWQRNFHDRIIRNEKEYNYLAQYVHTNPQRWNEDVFNE